MHRLDTEYFNKISAIEFAVKYDDEKAKGTTKDYQIGALGRLHYPKTPLSIYLANKGYKVSNLPLIQKSCLRSWERLQSGRLSM